MVPKVPKQTPLSILWTEGLQCVVYPHRNWSPTKNQRFDALGPLNETENLALLLSVLPLLDPDARCRFQIFIVLYFWRNVMLYNFSYSDIGGDWQKSIVTVSDDFQYEKVPFGTNKL